MIDISTKYQLLLDTYLKHRKEHPIDEKGSFESYKWSLITECNGLPPEEVIQRALKVNLFSHYEIDRIKWLLDNHKKAYVEILNRLLDETNSLKDRIYTFHEEMIPLFNDYQYKNNLSNDERTAAVFLGCCNPQKYSFYTPEMYNEMCNYLGVTPQKTYEKYCHYLELLQPLKRLIENSNEIHSLINPIIKDSIHSELLLAQDVCWEMFAKNPQLIMPSKKFKKKIIDAIEEDQEFNRLNIGDNFIWIGTKDSLIGTSECHYEIIWTKNRQKIGHDGKTVFVETHFEKLCNLTPSFRKILEDDKRIKKFTWSKVKTKGLRINEKGFSIETDDLEKLVKDVMSELHKLHEIVYPAIKSLQEQSKNMETINRYRLFLEKNHNVIFTGAPGTGKTFLAKQIAAEMIGCDVEELKDNKHFGFVQFHPSYDYTDFVEGLRPSEDEGKEFERKDGIFKNFCTMALQTSETNNFDTAFSKLAEYLEELDDKVIIPINDKRKFAISLNGKGNLSLYTGKNLQHNGTLTKDAILSVANGQPMYEYRGCYYEGVVNLLKEKFGLNITKQETDKPFVFIIDEINRGEISKVFGELFFSLDPGYRGVKGIVKTQYQNMVKDGPFVEGFYVPDNVYIIGTMNDIDRSVESLDFAFRRRFPSIEIKYRETLDSMLTHLNNSDWIGESKKRLMQLNDLISSNENLGEEFSIGGSYILKLNDVNGSFNDLWRFYIEPVIYEYLKGLNSEDRKSEIVKFKSVFCGDSEQ